MKKLIALILSTVILLLASCGTAPTTAPSTEEAMLSTNTTSTEAVTDGTTAPTTDATTATTTVPTTEQATTETTEPASSSTSATESTTQATEGTTKPSETTEKETESTTAPSEAVVLALDVPSLSLFVGDTVTLGYTYTGANALTWRSSNTAVATVDSNGKVTAKGAGTAIITLTDGRLSVTCKVTVNESNFVLAETLSLNNTSLTMVVGESKSLSYTYTGNKTLTWTSNNTSIATVDSKGKVTAKSTGMAVITLTDGFKNSQCVVTVKDYDLYLHETSLTMNVGEYTILKYTYTGNKILTWKSSNTSIATVDSKGKVTAKSAGTAVITLTDGFKNSQCVVTVKEADYNLSLNKTSLTLNVGESTTLTYSYTGTKALTWKSSDTSIVTVDSKGKVTAKKAGTAVITLTDGFKNSQCVVTVKEADYDLSLHKNSLTMNVGESTTLTYTYTGTKTLTWRSSNTSVATVSNGKVTAKGAGTATITLTDGNKSATCMVTVKVASSVGKLTIHTPYDTVVYVGETLQIDYTYTGDKSKLHFVSEDTSILTVTNSGLVTGVSAGSCYVDVYHGDTNLGYVCLWVKDRPAAAKSIEVFDITGPYFNGVSVVAGNYMKFTAVALTDAKNQQVKASSSNTSVATVSLESTDGSNWCCFKISFKSAGSTTITITSEDGNVSKSYTINVKSGYACNPGKNQLTPEEFAYYATQVMVENGAKATTSGGYRVLTLSDSDLTWYNAYTCGEAWVREFWPIGIRYMGLVYQGVNENGEHVFHIMC